MKHSCDGCGAPLNTTQVVCDYCLRPHYAQETPKTSGSQGRYEVGFTDPGATFGVYAAALYNQQAQASPEALARLQAASNVYGQQQANTAAFQNQWRDPNYGWWSDLFGRS